MIRILSASVQFGFTRMTSRLAGISSVPVTTGQRRHDIRHWNPMLAHVWYTQTIHVVKPSVHAVSNLPQIDHVRRRVVHGKYNSPQLLRERWMRGCSHCVQKSLLFLRDTPTYRLSPNVFEDSCLVCCDIPVIAYNHLGKHVGDTSINLICI